jgi:hypothetical protein
MDPLKSKQTHSIYIDDPRKLFNDSIQASQIFRKKKESTLTSFDTFSGSILNLRK